MQDPIELPARWKAAGWKVKIYSNERLEPPHVTLICNTRRWRIGLRSRDFLVPPGGRWRDIPQEMKDVLELKWQDLCDDWDAKHPTNPVSGEEDEDDGG